MAGATNRWTIRDDWSDERERLDPPKLLIAMQPCDADLRDRRAGPLLILTGDEERDLDEAAAALTACVASRGSSDASPESGEE
jgi:hypothetical protein